MLIFPAGASYLVPLLVLFMAAKCVRQVAVSLATPQWPPPAITPTQVMNTDQGERFAKGFVSLRVLLLCHEQKMW